MSAHPAAPSIADNRPHRLAGLACGVVCGLLLLATSGCEIFGFADYAINGLDEDKKVVVKSEYHGLENKKTAVIVAADEFIYYEYPTAPLSICRAVSARLKEEVKGIKITNPGEIDHFQKDNPYWTTLTPSDLIKHLKVDRLVYIDVSEFGLHEPGNAEIWHGMIDANVSVAEADTKNPDDFVYTKQVETAYPPNNPVGLLSSDDQVIQAGLLKQFAMYVSGLFNDSGAKVPK